MAALASSSTTRPLPLLLPLLLMLLLLASPGPFVGANPLRVDQWDKKLTGKCVG